MTISRRAFLAASAAVWTAPTVLAATRADAAQIGSRPPAHRDPLPAPPAVASPPPAERPTLAFTGNEERRNTELGVAALAAGAAVVAITHQPRSIE